MENIFEKVYDEAADLNKRKNKICIALIKKIGSPRSKYSPNHAVTAVAKSFILSGARLSEQIISAVRRRHLLIAVLGLRPLFELMINAKYTYDHPKYKRNIKHQRRVCKSVFKLSNKKRKVIHSKIDNKTLAQRAGEVKLLKLYETNYRGLSDWGHLMLRTIKIERQNEGDFFGMQLMESALCLIHDVIESICEGFNLEKDEEWGNGVATLSDKVAEYEKNNGRSTHNKALAVKLGSRPDIGQCSDLIP